MFSMVSRCPQCKAHWRLEPHALQRALHYGLLHRAISHANPRKILFVFQLPFFEQLEKFVRSMVAPSDSGCLRRAWGSNRRGSQNPKARLHNDNSPGGSIKDGGSNRRGGYTSLMGN